MAALPTVPRGAIPWEVYLAALEAQLYPAVPDPHTFSIRAYALMAVCSFGVLISIAYGLALLQQHRTQGRKLWVARKIDGYLQLNLSFFVPFGGAIGCIFMLVYTILQHNLFTLASHPSPSLYPTNAFRTYAWIPLILHGYTVAAAASQACVVVCHRTSALQQFSVRPSSVLRPLSRVSRLPRPMVVNTIFWSGLVVLTLMLVIPDVLFTVSWTVLYSRIEKLEAFLLTQRAAWVDEASTPVSLSQLLELQQLFDALSRETIKNYRYQQGVVYALIIAPFVLVVVITLATLLLHLLLRRQIQSRTARQSLALTSPYFLAQLESLGSPLQGADDVPISPTQTIALSSASAVPEFVLSLGNSGAHTPDSLSPPASPAQEKAKDEARPTGPRRYSSFSALGSLAKDAATIPLASWRRGSDNSVRGVRGVGLGVGNAEARKEAGEGLQEWELVGTMQDGNEDALGELRRANRDLAVCTGVVLLMGTCVVIENIWNCIAIIPVPYPDLNFTEIECAFFLPPWIYSTIYSVAPTILLVSMLVSNSPASRRPSCDLAGENGDSFVANKGASDAPSSPDAPVVAFLRMISPRHWWIRRRSSTQTLVAAELSFRRGTGVFVEQEVVRREELA